jgi:hypothetical protein
MLTISAGGVPRPGRRAIPPAPALTGGRLWAGVTLPGLSDGDLVYARLTPPDDGARRAGITAADDGEISCEEVIGRLKACLGEAT